MGTADVSYGSSAALTKLLVIVPYVVCCVLRFSFLPKPWCFHGQALRNASVSTCSVASTHARQRFSTYTNTICWSILPRDERGIGPFWKYLGNSKPNILGRINRRPDTSALPCGQYIFSTTGVVLSPCPAFMSASGKPSAQTHRASRPHYASGSPVLTKRMCSSLQPIKT